MSAISPLGTNQLPPSLLAGLLPPKPQPNAGFKQAASSDIVSISPGGLDLSRLQNALNDRVDHLESAASDTAQNFLMNFAKQALGNAADGMQVSFDAVGVSASSHLSAMTAHAQDANGTSDLAAMELDDAADFIGRGSITTADGHKYSFEVQVHYESTVQAASASTATNGASSSNDAASNAPTSDTPTSNAPGDAAQASPVNLHFPGKLKDLFNLLKQGALQLPVQMPSANSGKEESQTGTLTLRLLDKLDHPNPLLKQLFNAYNGAPADQSAVQA